LFSFKNASKSRTEDEYLDVSILELSTKKELERTSSERRTLARIFAVFAGQNDNAWFGLTAVEVQ
jgi:hypothetical protein